MDETNCDTDPESEPESGDDRAFEAALAARYKRLSLLTLDLAQEAGEAVRDFARVDLGKARGRFDHGVAAMSRAVWAHTVIERLRTGKAPRLDLGAFPSLDTPSPTENNYSTHTSLPHTSPSGDFAKGTPPRGPDPIEPFASLEEENGLYPREQKPDREDSEENSEFDDQPGEDDVPPLAAPSRVRISYRFNPPPSVGGYGASLAMLLNGPPLNTPSLYTLARKSPP